MWDILSGVGDFIGGLFGAGAEAANTALQAQQFNYQKDLQERIFQREDSAYQRQVADLEKAGLNKSLAYGSGGAGAGSVVGVSAPQINAGNLSNSMQSMFKGLKGLTKKNRDFLNAGYQYEMDKLNAGRKSLELDLAYQSERNNLMREQVKLAQSNIVAQNLANDINQNWFALEDWDKNKQIKNLWYDAQRAEASKSKEYSEIEEVAALNLKSSYITVNIDGKEQKMNASKAIATIQEFAYRNGITSAQFTADTLKDAIKNLGHDKFMERFNTILYSGKSMLDIVLGVGGLVKGLPMSTNFGQPYTFSGGSSGYMRNVTPAPYGIGYSPYLLQ